ncbi:DEAD/DEAH box helicase [Stutzerimonas kirkiae]|uniref:DEAD/DEAH box helicase n=1 Tax=Stutzerimonas kirkiae TaxID=2211392 RepID=UPI0010383CC5|nr:DEAD/DEAH box helicase [Stutzerimonas kirkiae]TBV11258.1 ATP-dependent helicase [Stutzerimonas kirkiae]
MDQMTHEFSRIPRNYQALLYSLATSFPGRSKSALLKQLREMRCRSDSGRLLDHASLADFLQPLLQQGWITQRQLKQANETTFYGLPPQLHGDIVLHLLSSADRHDWLRKLRASQPQSTPWQPPSRPRLQQDIWLGLLEDDLEGLSEAFYRLASIIPHDQLHAQHPLQQLLASDSGRKALALLAAPTRELLLETSLGWHNLTPGAGTPAYQLALQEADSLPPGSPLGLQLVLQALYRGDWQAFATHAQDSFDILGRTAGALLHGQPGETLAAFQQWLAAIRKSTRKRKIELPGSLNALYCMALIAQHDPQHYTELKQAIEMKLKAGQYEPYRILERLQAQLLGAAPAQLRTIELPKELYGLDGLLGALGLYWQDSPNAGTPDWCLRLQKQRDLLERLGYHWLAAEFDALIARQFGLPHQFTGYHAQHGLQPLVDLYQRQEAWQHALNALARIKSAPPATTASAAKKARLVWLLNLDSYYQQLEPREQRLGTKGQWSKGKAVALKRLREESDSLDFLVEQDRQAIQMIQSSHAYYGSAHYELPLELALPKLIGHPALFWSDAPDVRIDLVAGQPCLHLQEHNGNIRLRLQPEGIGGSDGPFLERETPTRLVLYPVTRELRQIADIVGEELNVPRSAKAQLVEAIGSIAPLLPIHSDIPELAGQVDEIAADTTLYAHLLPLAEGLRLQLLVRPLGEGGWFRPGHGSERLLGEQQGRTVQVVRDLHAEKQALQQVLDACPGLARADSDGQEWQLEQPQDALQVLSELQALDGDRLQCVWPEGERMRIKGNSSLQQLKLGLKQQGDWFQLQGSITLDDGKVLQLRQLLELLQASPGRFLKLGENDWLAIGDSLRKRLDELAHLAERVSDQGLRLSPLSAPLLASLAEEVDEFKAGADWQGHLERLQSLRHYQPQLPSTLQAELRDYQQEGFTWLARLAQWGVGACLADDMGLGKTVQTLALLLQRAALGPQLVVAPTSVTLNWQAESRRFAPTLQLRDYQRQRSLDDLGPRDLVIVSYGLLQQDSEAFAAIRWSSVVLDEAQAIKNAQSKRSQAAMALQADFRLVATGTPLENHLGELWNLFRFINPGLLGSQDSFAQRFANPIENGDPGARRALKNLIQPFILRRLKNQVLDELPARTEITYKVPLSDDEALQYEALRQQAVDKLANAGAEDGQALQVLAEITRLRRFCCHPSLVLPGSPLLGSKLRAFQQIVTELLENRHKALVFSQFVDHLSIVRAWLERQGIVYQYLDGGTPAKARQAAVEAFQAGTGEVFLISLKAGGSGLNLTAADYVIHLDPWWNPAVEDQASDRAHRMGQQRPVTIYRLVTENTIEEQIVALHGRKRDLADSLLDGGEVSGKLDADALLQLLRGR